MFVETQTPISCVILKNLLAKRFRVYLRLILAEMLALAIARDISQKVEKTF